MQEVLRISIREEEDILIARRKVRQELEAMGFRRVDRTRIITAVSELTRNIVQHAGEGELIARRDAWGIEIICQDQGPGMPDVAKALEEGCSTAGTLGMGLIGAKRLMDHFKIETGDQGTKVTIYKRLR
jgi:serine/threonine-protein kinase RsbT